MTYHPRPTGGLMRPLVPITTIAALAALTACGTQHTTDDNAPAPNRAAYNAGYNAGTDALKTGNANAVMKGDQAHAAAACENIVAIYYNGGNGTLPPGFTQQQKENWYTGCEDALEGLGKNDRKATATQKPSTA